ncbi:MAG: hypothetical protein Q8O62_02895 [Aequorivita sp.]|nr:hypothetical protein [Aequorivita sp.]
MRSCYLLVVLAFYSTVGCVCQKNIVGAEINASSSGISKIEGFLMEPTFTLVSSSSEISVYLIENSLIEGSTDEYSNKLVFQKKLEKEIASKFVKDVLSDTSYEWSLYKDQQPSFSPIKQIILKNSSGQLNLMYDPKDHLLGFINLEGQQIVPVTKKFHQILINL